MKKKLYNPGVHDITNEEYHASEGISRSAIMEFLRSPKHYKYKYRNDGYVKIAPSPAMEFGSAFHMYVLERSKFVDHYYIGEKFDRRTKEGKEAHKESLKNAEGRTLISDDDFFKITTMFNSLDGQALELITGARYEKSIYWTDPDSGLLCKCRPDIWHPNFIVDLKTAADASPQAFQRAFFNSGYYIQVAMMSEAIKHTEGREMRNFIDLAIETSEPYVHCIYPIAEFAVMQGIHEFKATLLLMKECFESGEFPGYNTQELTIPAWAKRDLS